MPQTWRKIVILRQSKTEANLPVYYWRIHSAAADTQNYADYSFKGKDGRFSKI